MTSGQEMNDEPEDAFEAEPQTESSGAGGGKKRRTSIGTGDDSGGSYRPGESFGGEPWRNEPIRHSRLKGFAIDALERSDSKDWADVYSRLLGRFSEFGLAQEALADILASLVVSAYTVALYVPGPQVFGVLRTTFACFQISILIG